MAGAEGVDSDIQSMAQLLESFENELILFLKFQGPGTLKNILDTFTQDIRGKSFGV